MKVLLCHNEYRQPGGEDLVFLEERWLLEENGHETVVFSRHNDAIEGMNRLTLAGRTIWNRETHRALREVIRRERPALMHCANTFPLLSPAAYHAARAEGVAVVQTLHNYRLLCPAASLLREGRVCEDCVGRRIAWPSIVHRCYQHGRAANAVVTAMLAAHHALGTWARMVDTYIALTDFSRRKFIEGGLPAEKIRVKPNFVKRDPGVGSGAGGYAVFVGRLSAEKGIQTLLDAWTRLRSSTDLVIVGQGPLADRVQAASRADPRIRWLGWRSIEEVLEILGEAAFLVVPSTWYETFGRVVVEAFAKGTPVIASDHGALAELVEGGETGLLSRPGSPEALAEAVAWLLSRPRQLARMRRAARAAYEAEYTAEANHRLLMACYEAALERARARRVPIRTDERILASGSRS